MEVKVVPVGQTEGLQATHNPILIKDSQPGAVEAPRSLQPIFGLHTIKVCTEYHHGIGDHGECSRLIDLIPVMMQPLSAQEPLSVFLAATDKASPGNGGVEVSRCRAHLHGAWLKIRCAIVRLTSNPPELLCRLPPGEKDKVVVCAKLKAGDRLCITKALDGWGKLHPSMKDVVRGNPGFKEFDAETEGWVMLWDSAPLVLWRIESIGASTP